ncbi:3-keto-disaccharide hydrolase [Fuerstiella marisgermanici]|uniref:3-keto-alpha-glucoside-1,2-lyase/3-keto-2-hydroxy-glucal hydratase domain-containing protein n=1 Tax=Fuerstiella marisgermanici TaxID=1891926 RepID=A0A1P8WQ23_9PLAN|nr:DUF1080 domain-containing protein [Fuerstiella marisgermanici]APZ96163.1 hypothetical protein Fuma_05831 [Fuerstiella marisgermanici]
MLRSRLLVVSTVVIATGLTITSPNVFGADDESAAKTEDGFTPLFDGKTAEGWNGDMTVFRIEDSSLVGGQLNEKIPHNFFLAHDKTFGDFELRLQFKLIGEQTNAGIQIRSKRIPDHHEMIGYQADLGQKYWGALYDESRRRKILAAPDADELAKVLKKDDWNDYRIRCEGPRIQLWINGLQTVDYTEEDKDIPLTGKVAVQIHSGPPGEAWYRNIRIKPLK